MASSFRILVTAIIARGLHSGKWFYRVYTLFKRSVKKYGRVSILVRKRNSKRKSFFTLFHGMGPMKVGSNEKNAFAHVQQNSAKWHLEILR